VEVELATINQFLADMLLPFMRISGLFVAMIGLSAKSIPPQVRALLGIMLTLIIMPVVPPSPIENLVDVGTFLIVIQQLLIGIAIGFISMMVLNTFVLAGQVIAMQTGLGFASIVDPVNGINVPAVGQFYLILATLLFWTLDGHLSMIQMKKGVKFSYFVDSFSSILYSNSALCQSASVSISCTKCCGSTTILDFSLKTRDFSLSHSL
jgi:flagellar biosynthetic protein FliR